MNPSAIMRSRGVRTALKVLLIALIVGVVILRTRFAATAVEMYPVALGDIGAEVMGTGTLEARVKTTVSPKIEGRLDEIPVDQNDQVVAGQLLASLDGSELQQQVEIADATLKASRGSVNRIRTDEARAQAAEARARQEFERMTTLVASKAVAQSDLDTAVETLHVAEADLRRVAAAIAEAELQVITAEKNLRYQEELFRNTRIVSPFAGLVVRRDRDPGDVVVPGSSILQLVSTKEMWISAWVDETAMAGLAPGQAARVVFRSEPDKRYAGEVVRLGRETDRETREFLVDVRVKELPANWAVGQRAEVQIETGRKSGVLVVPERMLVWNPAGPGMFVIAGDKARWRAVTPGMRGTGKVEILSGLSAGDRVITASDPKNPLADGKRIKVR